MPSPIAHTTMGYMFYRLSKNRFPDRRINRLWSLPVLLVVSIIVSLLPDIDAVFGIAFRDFSRFHNNGTHSLFSALGVSLVIAAILSWWKGFNLIPWFLIIFLNYATHIILDFFTYGRGVMLFWPFSSQRFSSPIPIFLGVRWSEGWISIDHLWTFATEVIFVFIVLAIFGSLKKPGIQH